MIGNCTFHNSHGVQTHRTTRCPTAGRNSYLSPPSVLCPSGLFTLGVVWKRDNLAPLQYGCKVRVVPDALFHIYMWVIVTFNKGLNIYINFKYLKALG